MARRAREVSAVALAGVLLVACDDGSDVAETSDAQPPEGDGALDASGADLEPKPDGALPDVAPQDAGKPATRTEWLVFAFRELARSDFCFLVLFLAAFDATWILLPAGAIGAQVYWAAQFLRRAREFHA